jgi:hypothetical protein
LFGVYPVTGTVFLQPLLSKCIFGHFKVGSYSFNIFIGKGGRHGFAAIGTGQAIGFSPNYLIHFHGKAIQLAGRVLFQFGKKPSEGRAVGEHFALHLEKTHQHNDN